ncbi:amino acid ABC transporter permease [uncultured Mitsuokella sp.]|uniref:amino acid ABC transporter permease n=2 Tax=uncultured Mitsuokella sp. TaxID=453120 RepID=UPI0025940C78|nr:amino acid ABC transporter permease [uncultured Mitsuokella sp.]
MGTYFDVGYMIKSFPTLLGLVHITLLVTIFSAIVGILIGAIIAVLRIQRVPVIAPLLRIFISFMRGTPFLVQLFLAYFGVPEILAHVGISMKGVSPLVFVLAVFTLHMAAYGAEILRSSILAVPVGEKEAAMSLGMTTFQMYRRVVLPQAFQMAMPALINTVIGVVKGTSLIFNVGVVDIMRKAELMAGNSQRSLELYVDVAVIYGILIFLIARIGWFLERRQSHSRDIAELSEA